MIIFWILYGLAGLAFVIVYLEYLLPWVLKYGTEDAEKAQMRMMLNEPTLKAGAGTLIFLVWPILFFILLGYTIYFIALVLKDEAVYWTVRAYHGIKVEWAKFKYRRDQMKEYRKVEQAARASYKKMINLHIADIMKNAKEKANNE